MRASRQVQDGGFTLIELMIVVAIIGILAAVAIPQFLDQMKDAKKNEAEISLDAIEKGAATLYARNGSFPSQDVGAGALVPDMSCCEQSKDRRCVPSAAIWHGDDDNPSVWDDLNFELTQPHFYRYQYDATDGGKGFVAQAVGDLDCDNDLAIYSVIGELSGDSMTYRHTKPARAD